MPWIHRPGGVKIHSQVTGPADAPPVLLIQGLGMNKNGWTLQRVAMATKYRTIAMDNRGAGRSSIPLEPFTLENMADDACAVLDHHGVADAHIVGASMGGAIAQILAVKHPNRVRSLTLACTACRNLPWRNELLRHWADTANVRGLRQWADESARWLVGPRSFRRLAPAIGWLGPLATFRPSRGFSAQVGAILDTDDSMVAARRLQWMGSVLLPGASVALVLALGSAAAWTISYVRGLGAPVAADAADAPAAFSAGSAVGSAPDSPDQNVAPARAAERRSGSRCSR